MGPGARWPRLPPWVGGEGWRCGASVFRLPAAERLQWLRVQGCLRQAYSLSTAQGCLRQAYGG